MGQYVVNGEVIDVLGERPTAFDLKHAVGNLDDWVMANMPNGQVVKLSDTTVLPAEVQDFSIVPQFTYGR